MGSRALFVVVLVAFSYLLLEGVSRTYFVLTSAGACPSLAGCVASFVAPDPLLRYYPELRRPAAVGPRNDDELIDILILGGSVMNKTFTSIPTLVEERLSFDTRRRVRVFNLAVPAQTSRDSAIKYAHVPGHYDLVLVYHGINEARANNAPSSIFDERYEHYAWYREVGVAEDDRLAPWLLLPWTLRSVATAVGSLFDGDLVPLHAPRGDWLAHGDTIKTREPFRRNLGAIFDRARERGEPAIAMTFATHFPDDYSDERFTRLQTDYAVHLARTSLWGTPRNVEAAIDAHNAAVRELVRGGRTDYFVDQQALVPKRREYFNDACHFTVAGAERFVDNLEPVMLRALAERGRP